MAEKKKEEVKLDPNVIKVVETSEAHLKDETVAGIHVGKRKKFIPHES